MLRDYSQSHAFNPTWVGHARVHLVWLHGSERPTGANPVRDFVPTPRPGSRLPHAWVARAGERLSVLDLLPYDGFTVLAGPEGAAWAEAVAGIRGLPLRCLIAGRDFTDPEEHWAAVCEITASGALLVRPDQHVAWRARVAPLDPAAALASAVRTVLGRAGAPGGAVQT